MTTSRKVALVLGIVAALIVLVIGAGWIAWRRFGPAMIQQGRLAMTEGQGFGRTATAQQCVDSVLTRHGNTSIGFTGTVVQSLFLRTCLDTGSELGTLCAQNTGSGVIGGANWKVAICRARQFGDRYCPTMLQPLLEACRKRAPPGARG
jgi:hypothetical protein